MSRTGVLLFGLRILLGGAPEHIAVRVDEQEKYVPVGVVVLGELGRLLAVHARTVAGSRTGGSKFISNLRHRIGLRHEGGAAAHLFSRACPSASHAYSSDPALISCLPFASSSCGPPICVAIAEPPVKCDRPG